MVKPKGLPRKSKPAATRPSASAPSRPTLTAPTVVVASETVPGDTERRILAAARKEFIAKGLDGARMQAIALEAGVNKALLHYYYRSKDRLYRTVLQDTLQSVWGKLRIDIQRLTPGDGLETLIRTLVGTYLRTLASNPEFPHFMLREMSSGGAAFQSALKEVGMPFGDIPARMVAALKAEIKAGSVKPVNPLHFFMNIMGMSLATFLTRPLIEKMAPLMGASMDFGGKYLDDRIQSIVDTAMNGIRTRKG